MDYNQNQYNNNNQNQYNQPQYNQNQYGNYQAPYGNSYQTPSYAPQSQGSVGGGALTCGLISLIGPMLINMIVLGGLSLTNARESLETVVISYVISLGLAITAICLGSRGMSVSRTTGASKGKAVAGLVLGIIATVIAASNILCYIGLTA